MNPPKGIDPKVWETALGVAEPINPGTILYGIIAEAAAKTISRALEAEREECAKLCEDHGHSNGRIRGSHKHMAKAIRNRSNTTTERNEG